MSSVGWLPIRYAGAAGPADVGRHQEHRDLLRGQLLCDGLYAADRGGLRPGGVGRDQITDGVDGAGGDLAESGPDLGAQLGVAVGGHGPGSNGGDGAQ